MLKNNELKGVVSTNRLEHETDNHYVVIEDGSNRMQRFRKDGFDNIKIHYATGTEDYPALVQSLKIVEADDLTEDFKEAQLNDLRKEWRKALQRLINNSLERLEQLT